MEAVLSVFSFGVLGSVVGLVVVAIALICAFSWRVVVPTNLVHIVQSAGKTTSYGSSGKADSKNAYYHIPSFVPLFGVTRIALPVNNFSIKLDAYDAYDKDRAPFELDLIGFFVITDTNTAAARAASFIELEGQLKSIMQGAARSVLAQYDINQIMGDRQTFGTAFTNEVNEGLKAWGVSTVKSLELMDIRDAKGSKIIANIMAKKASHIEMESRTVVAENARLAQLAEIESVQAVELRKQEQAQLVGQRNAQQEQEVGIAKERADQAVQEQAKITMERTMAVAQVQRVREAEIAREQMLVKADAEKKAQIIAAEAEAQVRITEAEGNKQQTVITAAAVKEQTVLAAQAEQSRLTLVATGAKDAALLRAQGIEAEGKAEGAAKQAVLLAPVNAQLTLAKEIGENKEYQTYLIEVRRIEAGQVIGVENAKALANADIKVIATSGDASSGIATLPDVLTARGGVQLGSMLQGLANTDVGKSMLSAIGLADAKPVTKGNGAAR